MVWLYYMILISVSYIQVSYQEGCQTDKGPQIVNGNVISVQINEDIVAPKGIDLLLNSTIKTSDERTICVNRISHEDNSGSVDCMPAFEINGYVALQIDQLEKRDNQVVYSWSASSDKIGETMISVHEGNEQINVKARLGKTVSVVFDLKDGVYRDVAMTDINGTEIYDYQPSYQGDTPTCHVHSTSISPKFGGRYHITTFDNIKCNNFTMYNFSATHADGDDKSSIFKSISFGLKEERFLNLYASSKSVSTGDSVNISCHSSKHDAELKWMFNEQNLEIIEGHYHREDKNNWTSVLTITDISYEQIGTYTCKASANCNVVEEENLTLSLNEIEIEITLVNIQTEHCGNSFSVFCKTNVNSPIHWTFENKGIQNDTKYKVAHTTEQRTSVLTIFDFRQEDYGVYLCKIYDKNADYWFTAKLNVNDKVNENSNNRQEVVIRNANSLDATICPGSDGITNSNGSKGHSSTAWTYLTMLILIFVMTNS